MHPIHSLALLAASAIAAPTHLVERQFGGLGGLGGGSTENDIQNGVCKRITFIMARGSTEPGNMASTLTHAVASPGSTVGPSTCSGLKQAYPNDVACQGVGGAYSASIGNNALPGGTDSGSIGASVDTFNLAAKTCPDTIMVGGGYSQGAAVMTRSVGTLPDNVKSRIAGVVLYGDTQNQQTGGSIPDYPKAQTLVICAASDGVCGGALLVTAGHLSYAGNVPDAVKFLGQQVSRAGTGGSTGGNTSSTSGSTGSTGTGSSSTSGSSSSSSGSSSGLGGLSGGLGGLSGSSGSSGLGGLGGLGSLSGSSGSSGLSGLGGLGSLGGSSGSSGLSGLGGLGSLGGSSGSSGLSGLGSLGGSSGSSGLSGLSGLGSLGGGSSGLTGLSGLGSSGSGGLSGLSGFVRKE
ncbi:hypothetical protein B0A48_01186 [Cryoendolithus antarcticus]|uniref:cutinase n=1 Tax=Cryoendolithus antarcticus TaxID=1507870 RepID=A0A1V8TSH2_9PEZI|nr:hypothetical protein B0A48_01186 [Cryoendolithus antarcticus]